MPVLSIIDSKLKRGHRASSPKSDGVRTISDSFPSELARQSASIRAMEILQEYFDPEVGIGLS